MSGKRIVSIIAVVLNFVVCFAFLGKIPDMISLGGNNGSLPKIYLYAFPLLNLIVTFSFSVFEKLLSLRKVDFDENELKNKPIFDNIDTSISVILLYFTMLILYVFLGYYIEIEKFAFSCIGALFIIIADNMNEDKKFASIRTPWTLKSKYVLKKSITFAKFMFVILGILNTLIIFIGSINIIIYYLITISFIFMIYLFSYLCYVTADVDEFY